MIKLILLIVSFMLSSAPVMAKSLISGKVRATMGFDHWPVDDVKSLLPEGLSLVETLGQTHPVIIQFNIFKDIEVSPLPVMSPTVIQAMDDLTLIVPGVKYKRGDKVFNYIAMTLSNEALTILSSKLFGQNRHLALIKTGEKYFHVMASASVTPLATGTMMSILDTPVDVNLIHDIFERPFIGGNMRMPMCSGMSYHFNSGKLYKTFLTYYLTSDVPLLKRNHAGLLRPLNERLKGAFVFEGDWEMDFPKPCALSNLF